MIPARVKDKPLEVWFQDEARLGQKNGIVRQWAKRGTRPRQPADQRYANAYLFGAICPARGTGAGLALPQADTEAMQLHLAEISRHVAAGAHAVLLLDRAGWHTTTRLTVPHNITLVFLPSRAPELNPVENQLFEELERPLLTDVVLGGSDDVDDVAVAALDHRGRQPADQPKFRVTVDRDRASEVGLDQTGSDTGAGGHPGEAERDAGETERKLRDEVAALTQEVETRMATLEEVTAALGSAVDRIGTLLGETITAKDAAVAAAAAAQTALDEANAADQVEDAAAAQQIADLTAALQAAQDALNAQVASADAAVASIQSNVDELNALGAPAVEPGDVEPNRRHVDRDLVVPRGRGRGEDHVIDQIGRAHV